MRSTRSCSRARTSERGFALLWAIGIAVLFFMLIELMLIDSARELKEAQRFRSKIVAATLAENGAELVAARIVESDVTIKDTTDWQGKIYGEMHKNVESGEFQIVGTGETAGVQPAKARVEIKGKVEAVAAGPPNIEIFFTQHTP